mmetsp:Transcript_18968/g.28123  ORF Transcript_18968/g.28123 Transcript_18968/m.28123 type:complete len:340 (-) Transcript_18968:216-1235(-)
MMLTAFTFLVLLQQNVCVSGLANIISPTMSSFTNGDAAALRASEANTFKLDLDKAGLSLCHGILHASGCRQISDLRKLTPVQITAMGIDRFDSPVINHVIEEQKIIMHAQDNNDNYEFSPVNLSTCVNGAFVNSKQQLSRFEVPKPQGFDIEVICSKNDIYKGRLFTLEQCAQLNRMSEYHAYKGIGSVKAGWSDQIYTLTAQHMTCESIPGFISTTENIFRQLLSELHTIFSGRVKRGSIEMETSGEPHLVKYNGKAKGTVLHTDNDDEYAANSITVNVLLSDNDDFGGGGTYISAIDKTIKLEQGEMLIHLGNLEHAGADITFGVRRLLVAFLACEW